MSRCWQSRCCRSVLCQQRPGTAPTISTWLQQPQHRTQLRTAKTMTPLEKRHLRKGEVLHGNKRSQKIYEKLFFTQQGEGRRREEVFSYWTRDILVACGQNHGEACCSLVAHGGSYWSRYPCCSPWRILR